ncbi:MAG: CocE/NonD family hydrolase, partial [bacterium]|nr:CocE/NonD family hydrolase [bacterium]
NARRSNRNAGEDGYDTVEWIAKQAWSTGKVAITGYSEACFTSKSTVAERPPHLAAAVTAIGTLSRRAGTVRSGPRVSWGGKMPERPEKWSPPTGGATDSLSRFGTGELVKAAPKVDVYLVDRTGWFDFATQGAIDEWVALKGNGKSILIMGIGGHGALSTEARLPPAYGDCDILFSQLDQFAWLTGGIDESNTRSRMYYFLMGDATKPEAPGNVWKVTDTWPIPHTMKNWRLTGDGKLSADKPAAETGSLSFAYDPNDPVRTLLGARMPAGRHGPLDQSHLADRDDILRFDSEPLAEPLEITGQPAV